MNQNTGKFSLEEILNEKDFILLTRLQKEMRALKSSPNYKNTKLLLECSEKILQNQELIIQKLIRGDSK